MLIHEVPEGEGEVTLCCGMFPSFLRSGDLVTEHVGIVTCDNRVPRCPECDGGVSCLGMRVEPTVNFDEDVTVTILKVDPCAHEFRVRIGIQDSKIRLEKRKT